ncbi:MAG TPA: hypothetical protein VFG69_02590 [Nannocystaceae bacterium]|nr:hypothetical protein [Nannocystaceae bacterium]
MSWRNRALFVSLSVVGCADASEPPSAGDESSSGDGTASSGDGATSSDDVDATSSDDVDTTSSDGGTTELDCPGIFDCVGMCAEGDDPCVEACVARGTEDAIALADDVLVCAQTNGCTDEACLADNCSAELLACAGESGCDGAGKPEMTGPITGLHASYPAGDPMQVGVPVDEDTARVIVGIYEVGSKLYLGGTAEDVQPSSTATFDFFAGVVGGETGEFYIAVELCSTSVCTPPFVRNTYDRVDRTAPLAPGETYVQTREFVGNPAMPETCTTSIPIQSFLIE